MPRAKRPLEPVGERRLHLVAHTSTRKAPTVVVPPPQDTGDVKLLSLRQAADESGLHLSTIRRVVAQGDLAASKVGGRWYVQRRVLTAFCAAVGR